MSRIGMLSIALVVVAASCGGATSDDAPTTSPATEPETSVTTTSAAPTTTSAEPTTTAFVAAAVGDTEFCELISAQDTATETMDVFDPASVEKSIKDALDAIRGARDLVPSDIRGEYDTLASAFEGLVEALEESGWDMLAIDVNDPRILRMESPEVLSAADALNDFCGLEAGGTDGEAGARSPDAGAGSDAGLPDDLVAPGAVFLRDASGIKIFTSTASFDETVSYYEGVLGKPPVNVAGSAGGRVASFLSATPTDVLVQVEEGGGELLIYITLTG